MHDNVDIRRHGGLSRHDSGCAFFQKGQSGKRPRNIKPDVKGIPLNKNPMAYLEAGKAKIDSNLKLGIREKVDGVSRSDLMTMVFSNILCT